MRAYVKLPVLLALLLNNAMSSMALQEGGDPRRASTSPGRADAVQPSSASAQKECDVCPDMVKIQGGRFLMGSPAEEPGRTLAEGPVHEVTVASFLIAKTETTQGQWRAVMGYNPSRFSDCGDDCPVENVSWFEVRDYIKKLNLLSGRIYRLPSEAEWEFAARAGTQTAYPWGAAATHANANYGKEQCCEGLVQGKDLWLNTAPVGKFPSNGFGLYDMHGNALEWTQDIWHDNYNGAPTDGSAWVDGADPAFRVLRGGAFDVDPAGLRSSARSRSSRVYRNQNVGFRLARSL